MFLKNLKLTNYRNYKILDLEFGKTTLLIGKNAQGKSNLLESIYFLSTTKSPKAERDLQLIREGEDVLRVEGEVEDGDGDTKLEIVMLNNQEGFTKKTLVNGVSRRTMDYLGNFIVILFSPEDINLVVGPPSLRRWHLDLVLALIDHEYKRSISQYTQIITSRNKVLKKIKEGFATVSELDYWTQEAIKNAQIISNKRTDFFEFINKRKKDIGNFSYQYQQSLLTQERAKEYQTKEIQSSSSLIGPHRDDFIFKFNSQDLAYFGSRGEQRTAILDLKLSELEFIKKTTTKDPVLLLDDIFSELDLVHKTYVIDATKNQQTIISAVDDEHIPENFLENVKVLKIQGGEVIS